jgi:hypothetical protein
MDRMGGGMSPSVPFHRVDPWAETPVLMPFVADIA